MPPMLRGRTLPAKQIKVYFYLFAVRHALGIGLFTWVLLSARQVGNYVWVIAAALALYLVTALYNGVKIWGHYQKKAAEEAQAVREAEAGEAAAPTPAAESR